MPMYVLHCLDKPGALETRVETRPRHLAYMGASGKVRLGGPYLNDQGQAIGSLIIIEAADAAEAEAFSQGDPYRQAGVFETVEIRLWSYTAGQLP